MSYYQDYHKEIRRQEALERLNRTPVTLPPVTLPTPLPRVPRLSKKTKKNTKHTGQESAACLYYLYCDI